MSDLVAHMQPQANFVGGAGGCQVVFPYEDLRHSGLPAPHSTSMAGLRAREAREVLQKQPELADAIRARAG